LYADTYRLSLEYPANNVGYINIWWYDPYYVNYGYMNWINVSPNYGIDVYYVSNTQVQVVAYQASSISSWVYIEIYSYYCGWYVGINIEVVVTNSGP
jgi:hypothetical protein